MPHGDRPIGTLKKVVEIRGKNNKATGFPK
jgi:hypothetical protein